MVARRKILVVDDEPTVTRSCRRILAEEGQAVETAQSGREGLARALAEDFDLVMTDLKMPDLDGMELVRTLRRERPGTEIIIITGFGTIPSAISAMKLGVSEYLEKPFTPAQIVEAVRKALAPPPAAARIEADMVRAVLQATAESSRFAQRLVSEGSRVLSGFALSNEAKAAVVSGDIAWIEKRCGELPPEERQWLLRRLEVERW